MVKGSKYPLKMENVTVDEMSKKLLELPTASLQPVVFSENTEKLRSLWEIRQGKLEALGPEPDGEEKKALWQTAADNIEEEYREYFKPPKDGDEDAFWNNPFAISQNWLAVVVGQNVVNMVSPRYTVVQHHDAFQKVLDVIKNKIGATDIKASIQYTDTAAYMYVTLPQQYAIVAADKSMIDIGFMAVNSHDSTHSVEISGFGFRQKCTNGMVAKEILGSISITHVGAVSEALEQWVQGYTVQIEDLKAKIRTALSIGVTRPEAEAYFRAVSKDSKKFVQRAMELWDQQYEKELDSSMWALYNCATDMYSHESTGPKAMSQKLASAETLLVSPTIKEDLGGLVLEFRERDAEKAKEDEEKDRKKAYPGAYNLPKQEEKKTADVATTEPEAVDFAMADPLPAPKPAPEEKPASTEPKKETLETPDGEFSRVVSLKDLVDEEEKEEKKDKKKDTKKDKKGKK